MKNSFILYVDNGVHFALLSDEDAGKLIKAIFAYSADGTEPDDIPLGASVLFSVIKMQIDRDAAKWEEERKQRSEAGKTGAAARWNNRIPPDYPD